MMDAIQFHEAANIFPLDDEHIDELASDIRKHGLRVPIETLDGLIIDGRRRYLACRIAGVPHQIREVKVDDPVAYVVSLNLHRRHLSETQLGMVAARAREIYDRQAQERMRAGGGDKKSDAAKSGKAQGPTPIKQPRQSRDEAGKSFGVSGRTVDRATKVLKQGTPKLVAAVDANAISARKAEEIAVLPESQQDQIAEQAMEDARAGRKPQRKTSDATDHATNGDIKEKGVGVIRAHEAINCLTRIPKNDALRKRGFQIVTDWIRHNK